MGPTSPAALKASFSQRVLETHPDRGGSAERFRDVLAAHALLRGPERIRPSHEMSSALARPHEQAGSEGYPRDDREFWQWYEKEMGEDDAEERRRMEAEADQTVPSFFTWRLGLRILVGYLVLRGAVFLVSVNLPHAGAESDQVLAAWVDFGRPPRIPAAEFVPLEQPAEAGDAAERPRPARDGSRAMPDDR